MPYEDFLSVNVDAAAASILIAVQAVDREINDEQTCELLKLHGAGMIALSPDGIMIFGADAERVARIRGGQFTPPTNLNPIDIRAGIIG